MVGDTGYYKNRSGDLIKFEQISETEVKMTNYFALGCRAGYNNYETKEIQFVDPSGGPFISVGDSLDKLAFKGDKKGKIITEIKFADGGIIFTIKE